MNPVAFGQTGINSGSFDPGNKDQVLQMQGFLQDQGLYKGALDSQFGGKSEEAYRNYVNTQRTVFKLLQEVYSKLKLQLQVETLIQVDEDLVECLKLDMLA